MVWVEISVFVTAFVAQIQDFELEVPVGFFAVVLRAPKPAQLRFFGCRQELGVPLLRLEIFLKEVFSRPLVVPKRFYMVFQFLTDLFGGGGWSGRAPAGIPARIAEAQHAELGGGGEGGGRL
jgi:hypothetical protein